MELGFIQKLLNKNNRWQFLNLKKLFNNNYEHGLAGILFSRSQIYFQNINAYEVIFEDYDSFLIEDQIMII
ncbi:unnamed protein product [Paramecium primaurelia]|uniref:Uncharacterized protein n=1 Tax=Paramecium primaurelia TaxID=5886 RepID=A0A8S1LN90_PARPR|nr:unnamed protein product [Paramecium primaurelia]